MPFLLLLLLTLACLPDNWQSLMWGVLSPDPVVCAVLTWTGVAAVVAAAMLLANRTCRQLKRHPERSESILHRYRSGRLYHWLAQLVWAALFVLGWGWAVQSLGPVEDGVPQMLPGAELLILAPFLTSLVLSWACFYNVERAARWAAEAEAGQPFWGRWAYVSFHLRQNLVLVVVPVGLLMVQKGLRRVFADYQNEWEFQLIGISLIPMAFIGLPWVLRLVLGLKPLPQGALRDRLMTSARRLNFRFSNLLLWNTHSGVANAMVAGLVPSVRYVVLTDRLVSELTPDEVEAVFGHEVGHVKHRHMLYYLGFLLVGLAVVAGLWDLLAPLAAYYVPGLEPLLLANQDLAALPFVAILGTYIFIVFGFLSRRCERQADIFGCRAVSCALSNCSGHDPGAVLLPGGKGLCPTGIHTFIEALEKVARINGINRSRPGWLQSWQHSTIARRVEFLQRVQAEPALEARFQRAVGLVKLALFLGLCAVLLVLAGTAGGWDRLLAF